jgi:hypothetical protein
MRKFNLDISERNFALIWRSLGALEASLLSVIEENENDPDCELAAFAGNDLVYLRLYRDDLERMARAAGFSKNVFVDSEAVIKP